ncbi:MAG: TlpA family protein disulfide reductase [Candidatus Kapaibacteriota bacterium]
MKKILFIFIFVLPFLFQSNLFSQDVKTLPKVTVKDLQGNSVEATSFNNDGKPFLIDFWATWCVPCIRELNNISKVYDKWQEETGVKLIAISIDDSRTSKKVTPFVKGRGWKFEFFIDENSELKRAMNVSNPPHTFLVNGKGEIIWEHTGYADGAEDEVIAKVKELLSKEK